jgi:tetratricopeptide (TPR) repeat protein
LTTGKKDSQILRDEIEQIRQAELGFRRRRAEEAPNNHDAQAALAQLLEAIGDVKRESFKALESARLNYREAVQTLQPLVDGGDDPMLTVRLLSCLAKLSATCATIGLGLEREKRPGDALACYEEALGAKRELMRREPNDPERKYRVANMCRKIGELCQELGRREDARRYYDQAIEVGAPLLADPNSDMYRFGIPVRLAQAAIKEMNQT